MSATAAGSSNVTKTQQASELFAAIVPTPFGALGIRTGGAVITELVYLPPSFDEKAPQDGVAEQAAAQVLRYCDDPDFRFDLPLAQVGSEFQRKVWATISAIPRGEVRTYGEVAKHVGSMPRAVGQACGANYFPLVVPCHRVTGAQGLGGFAGSDDRNGFTLNVKRWLLAHEGLREYAWQQTTLL
ncbi:cysteine methyltransferase [Pseudoduganella armeniaca]|uniref:Cysteine methyltransferase n=1 Tax=Pseudoduganella armeniaca TaxID=2072590 RepID=A0A2R4CFW6_9BURK|nr:cysteine methyltransferase [Pseudoduganella armeniaca]